MIKQMGDESQLVEELRLGLRRHRGAIKEVAERLGRTRVWVSFVLAGKYQSNEVLIVASKVYKEREMTAAKELAVIRSNVKSASL